MENHLNPRCKASIFLLCFSLILCWDAISQSSVEAYRVKAALPCSNPPIISCPKNYTVAPGSTADPLVYGCATAIPGATGCNQPIVEYIDRVTAGTCPGSETIQRVWTASDPEDATVRSFCIQYIYKQDDIAPEFSNCPKDTSIFTNAKCHANFSWIMPWVRDNNGNFNVSTSHKNGDGFPIGVTRIIITATDLCGNSASCAFNLTVISNCCTQAPIIQCPTSFQSCIGSSIEPSNTGFATATKSSPICADPLVTFVDRVLVSSPCSLSIERTWIATDPNNMSLQANCTQIINLSDDQAPRFTNCPSNIEVTASTPDCLIPVNWQEPIATDDCTTGLIVVKTFSPGSVFGIGTHTVTYTATDACGKSANCSFTITVLGNCCNQAPILTCPADYNACPGASREPSITGIPNIRLGNTSCPNPIVNYFDREVYTDLCSSRVERKWLAIDPLQSNLRDSCTQILTFKDKTGPTFTFCPSDFTIDPAANCIGMPMWNEPIAVDNCGTVTLSSNYRSGAKLGLGNTLVIYTATDNCGNTSSCWFTITVNDNCCNKPPKITCPADYNGCPNTSTNPSTTGNATVALGNPSCGNPIISYADQIIITSNCSLRINRKWLAVDPNISSLRDSCYQIIDLADTEAPIFTSCPVDITIDPEANCIGMPMWSEPTVTDACGTVTLTSNYRSGAKLGLGNTLVIYTATDNCGNTSSCWFTITVNDNCCNKPPKITCPADYNGCPNTSTNPSTTGNATVALGNPSCGNPIISYADQIIITSNCSLRINRKWLAVDPNISSLRDSCYQIIDLADTEAPIFTSCPVDITIDPAANCIGMPMWSEPTVTDACGSVTLTSNYRSGAKLGLGNTLVVYTATDACGNSKTCWFTVTVNDNCCNKPPKITCPTSYQGCPNTSINPITTGSASVMAGHPTCGTPIVSYIDETIFTSNCSLRINRKWLAVDFGNAALRDSCYQIIDLADTEPPTLINCPTNITIDPDYYCVGIPQWTPPTVSDNCNGRLSLRSSANPGIQFPRGTTTVTYTATDACGNRATCSFTVTVTDNCCDRNPIITCPSSYTACPSSSLDPSITGFATAIAGKTNCLDPRVSYRDSILTSGPCTGAVKLIRIWTAVDPNIPTLNARCLQSIELKDDLAPTLNPTSMPNITVNANGDCEVAVNWIPPVANDNCGIRSLVSNYNSGHRFPGGVTTVAYTATDNCGRTVSLTFTVTVIGTEININCPNDTVIYRHDPYIPGETVCWNYPTAKYCKPCKDSIAGFIYMGEYKGHRYFCSLTPETWENARIQAVLAGGYLASINDQRENNYVASKLMGLTAWIGGTDQRSEGAFEWTNRDPFIYRNWLTGQPDNAGNQDYIEMRPDGKWNDQFENIANEFIVEVPCFELTQIEGPDPCTLLPCGTNKITYVATKDGVKDTCSFNVTVKCDTSSLHCEARAQSSAYMWIDHVGFAGINNTSGANDGYKLFSSPCGSITSGNSYSISLNPGYAGTSYTAYWKVWIDYDADSIWNNTTELVASGSGVSVLNGIINIPNGLRANKLRMRVSMAYGAYPSTACSSFLFGEVEDYCLSLNGGFTGNGGSSIHITPAKLHCARDCDKISKAIIPGTSNEFLGDLEYKIPVNLSLYPNPANEIISVELKYGSFDQFQIYDSKSKLILNKKFNQATSNYELDTKQLSNGLYYIILKDYNGSIVTKKFSIQH